MLRFRHTAIHCRIISTAIGSNLCRASEVIVLEADAVRQKRKEEKRQQKLYPPGNYVSKMQAHHLT
jgi:hypothetical protein